ncbi:MAG: hypothetical protein LBM64_05215 [Deltaproteobacteria bacterium]|jgi:chemotaxis protein MotB|nr:hypothetical protein [Deltaproteobacteria bacterium]
MADDDEDARPEDDAPPPLGVPEWMVTYGDMMTLLLCFFVLLFIFSKQEEEKYKAAVGSIQNAFGVKDSDPRSPFNAHAPKPDESSTTSLGQAEREVMNTVQETIMSSQSSLALQQSLVVDVENRGVVIRIYGDAFFNHGTARLKPGVRPLLEPVVAAMQRHHFNLLVRANVTSGELNTANYPTVWEFSAARSASALDALIEAGNIDPARLRAMGSGDVDIRVPPSDPRSEHYNNRLDFIFYLPGTEYW